MDAVDHVVLGAGAVGIAVGEALVRRGESVRVVNRSGLREPIAGVQSATGDVTDPAFAASSTQGARVIYQALNPPYHRWGQEFPGLQAAAIAAAQTAGARLVAMDNVYMYGRANGRPFTEDRAYDPHTRKGRVRAQMARDLMAAHDAGRVPVRTDRALVPQADDPFVSCRLERHGGSRVRHDPVEPSVGERAVKDAGPRPWSTRTPGKGRGFVWLLSLDRGRSLSRIMPVVEQKP